MKRWYPSVLRKMSLFPPAFSVFAVGRIALDEMMRGVGRFVLSGSGIMDGWTCGSGSHILMERARVENGVGATKPLLKKGSSTVGEKRKEKVSRCQDID